MEEKLKSSNMQPSETENSLYRRYQELSNQIQEKDLIVKRLEGQLEKQVRKRPQGEKRWTLNSDLLLCTITHLLLRISHIQ